MPRCAVYTSTIRLNVVASGVVANPALCRSGLVNPALLADRRAVHSSVCSATARRGGLRVTELLAPVSSHAPRKTFSMFASADRLQLNDARIDDVTSDLTALVGYVTLRFVVAVVIMSSMT